MYINGKFAQFYVRIPLNVSLSRDMLRIKAVSKTHRLVRFELLFNFVLPNLVAANEPAVNKTGSRRPRNVELLLPPPPPLPPPLLGLVAALLVLLALLLFLYKGLVEEIDAVSLGEPLGLLNVSAFIDELMISIGRKH